MAQPYQDSNGTWIGGNGRPMDAMALSIHQSVLANQAKAQAQFNTAQQMKAANAAKLMDANRTVDVNTTAVPVAPSREDVLMQDIANLTNQRKQVSGWSGLGSLFNW